MGVGERCARVGVGEGCVGERCARMGAGEGCVWVKGVCG